MTLPSPTYDLVLLLDPQAEEAARQKILSGVREAISAKGELVRHDEWGERPLAYQIAHRPTAEYHLLQFHPAQASLIEELNRTLHITDGIVRFRINKLRPGTPEAPDMRTQHAFAPGEPASEPHDEEPSAA